MITMAGCSDYLDSDYLFEERLNMEDVFTNKDYTNYWLAKSYSWLSTNALQDVSSKRTVPLILPTICIMGTSGYKEWKKW